MHSRSNRIYGVHVIIHDNRLFVAESSTVFEDFVVQGQEKGLVNWFSRIVEDNNIVYTCKCR